MPTIAQILARADFYETKAKALRLAAEEMNGHQTSRKQATFDATLQAAVATRQGDRDAVRREKDRARKAAKRGRYHHSSQVLARRKESANFLAQFDPSEPRDPAKLGLTFRGMGSLVRRKYLKLKNGGYIRTAKVYHVDPKHPATT